VWPRPTATAREGALEIACPAVEQAGDGPGGDQPAPVDDDAVVGDVLDLAEQVAGQEDRAAVVGEPPQEPAQRDVFPEPLAPRKTVIRPGWMPADSPSTAVTAPYRLVSRSKARGIMVHSCRLAGPAPLRAGA